MRNIPKQLSWLSFELSTSLSRMWEVLQVSICWQVGADCNTHAMLMHSILSAVGFIAVLLMLPAAIMVNSSEVFIIPLGFYSNHFHNNHCHLTQALSTTALCIFQESVSCAPLQKFVLFQIPMHWLLSSAGAIAHYGNRQLVGVRLILFL